MKSGIVKNLLWLCFVWGLGILGVRVSVGVLVQEFSMETVNINSMLIFAGVGAFMALVLMFLPKGKTLLAVLIYGCFIWFAWDKRNEVCGGMIYLVNGIIEKLNAYYGISLYYMLPTEDMIMYGSKLMFADWISMVLGFSYALIFFNGKGSALPVALTLVAYWLPATLEMKLSHMDFILSMMFVCACANMRGVIHSRNVRRNRLANMQAAVLTAALVFVCIWTTGIVKPEEDFEGYSALEGLKGKFVFTFEDIKMNFLDDITVDGISGGTLGDVDEVEYEDEAVLRVIAPSKIGTIYLKAYQAEVYSSSQWKNLSDRVYKANKDVFKACEKAGFYPQTAMMDTLGIMAQYFSEADYMDYRIQVKKLLSMDRYDYIPSGVLLDGGYDTVTSLEGSYDKVLEIDNNKTNSDGYYEYYARTLMENTDMAEFALAVESFKNGNLPLTEELYDYLYAEFLYRDFVYENYLEVNTKAADRIEEELLDEIIQDNYELEGTKGKLCFIYDTVEYLDDNYRYTLSPGATPSNEDFVEYFLFDTKQGYCTYFATAAVMIYRSAGIPARYVEGYIVPENLMYDSNGAEEPVYGSVGQNRFEYEMELVTLTITDRYAHAWVEVYIDGLGWMPVEVTPGYSPDYNVEEMYEEDDEDESTKEVTTESEEETTTAEAETDEEQESKTEEAYEEPSTEEASQPQENESSNGGNNSGKDYGKKFSRFYEEKYSAGGIIKSLLGDLYNDLKTVLKYLLACLKIFAIPIIIAIILIYRKKYMEQKRNRLYNEGCGLTGLQRIVAIMKYYEKIMAFAGLKQGDDESYAEYFNRLNELRSNGNKSIAVLSDKLFEQFEDIRSIMDKALYSKTEPTEDEIMKIMVFVNMTRQVIVYDDSNFFKKLMFLYIYAY